MVVAEAWESSSRYTAVRRARTPARKAPALALKAYALALVGCLTLFGINAFLHGFVTTNTIKVDGLYNALHSAENAGYKAELDIAYLSSYGRIAKYAESRMAMSVPASGDLQYTAVTTPNLMAVASIPLPRNLGLFASLGSWIRSMGRADASDR